MSEHGCDSLFLSRYRTCSPPGRAVLARLPLHTPLQIDETTAGTEDLRKHNEERLRQIRVDFELQLAEIRKGAPTDADDDDEEEHDENGSFGCPLARLLQPHE